MEVSGIKSTSLPSLPSPQMFGARIAVTSDHIQSHLQREETFPNVALVAQSQYSSITSMSLCYDIYNPKITIHTLSALLRVGNGSAAMDSWSILFEILLLS